MVSPDFTLMSSLLLAGGRGQFFMSPGVSFTCRLTPHMNFERYELLFRKGSILRTKRLPRKSSTSVFPTPTPTMIIAQISIDCFEINNRNATHTINITEIKKNVPLRYSNVAGNNASVFIRVYHQKVKCLLSAVNETENNDSNIQKNPRQVYQTKPTDVQQKNDTIPKKPDSSLTPATLPTSSQRKPVDAFPTPA